MKSPSRLRTRFVQLSVTVTSLTVLVFMAGTLLHLRYGMKQAMDQQLEALAPDILLQLKGEREALESEELLVLLAFFDEKNLIRLLRVEDRDGRLLYLNPQYVPLLDEYDEEQAEEETEGRKGRELLTLWFEGHSWRIGVYEDSRHRIVLAADLARLEQSLWQILVAFVFALPLAVAGAALATFLLARQASDPIETLTMQARSVTASRLDARLKLGRAPREVLQLGEIFNGMMDRLQRSFQQARRFSADASHELKSPLTVMQGILENHLTADQAAPLPPEETAALLEETLRMRAIVEALLVLAKADEGSLLDESEPVDLRRMLEEMAEDTGVLAESSNRAFEARLPAELPIVHGDGRLLRLAIHNLLSNALRHAGQAGRVRLGARVASGRVEVEVGNTGDGIPEDARERIFERFFRVDPERVRSESGLGLGLNIAREIARAHGGDLALRPEEDGWTLFRVTLPLIPPAPRGG